MAKLIVLRGNSGSGKTTIAKELQKCLGRNTMLISQDVIRRDMLRVKDGENTEALPLMKELLTYGRKYCKIVISQTLEHSRPFAISGCRRIMTIENKANYESMSYEEDVLYIFCHGYLTPKEVRFLKQLCLIAPKDCEFYHWGDMDFGGISIFQFIKEKVFPDLKPYRMDVKDFEEALAKGAGIPIKASTREKLEKKEAGLLTELKAEILRTGMTIEQERLL